MVRLELRNAPASEREHRRASAASAALAASPARAGMRRHRRPRLRERRTGQRDEREDGDRNEACVSHHGSPYETGCLPNFRSDDFHFEQDALRFDALLNVGELPHRHRRWSARDFHQHALELVE